MELITKFFYYLYVITLIVVGFCGLFVATWELRTIFHIDLSSMSPIDAATMSSQYRFLKGLELGCGCFSWKWRHEIFSNTAFRNSFLVIVWAGVFGRLVSLFTERPPHLLFIIFLVLEAITGLLMLMHRSTTQNG
jgi:Domain of unknown function (DUF4345)